MKPTLLFLLLGYSFFAGAQEMGKPVDFENPRVGDYLVADGFVYDLHIDAYETLRNAVESLKRLPDWKFQLESHTDCRASTSYNDTLSQMRADTLLNYVLAMGFPSWRITAKGMGERMLLMEKCSCDLTDYNSRICQEKEHQLNRRTIIRLTEKIEWTGYEPFSLKFPSTGQYRVIPFESSGDEAFHEANSKLWYFLDSLEQCENVYYTLYHLPGKRALTKPFFTQNRKRELLSSRLFVSIPSRMNVIHKRPGQTFQGIQSGYVVSIDSIVANKKILNEIGICGDSDVMIFDEGYSFDKEIEWEPIGVGGLKVPWDMPGPHRKYCLYIVTTNYPLCFKFYDPFHYKIKWIACQDTSGGDYIGYSARIREEFPNYPEIVEVRYINIPELKRPWMLILQPIKEGE